VVIIMWMKTLKTVVQQWLNSERERESLLQSGNNWKETVEKDDFTLKITAEQQ